MPTPSILSAIKKLKSLLTREEKIKWLGIVGFALCTSTLEVITASIIVLFAQALTQPETGQKYLSKLGFSSNLPPSRIILYISIMVGAIYLVKNLIAAAEVFFQNFSIQKMNYSCKNNLLQRYAEADYGFYLTRNSSLGINVISSDTEHTFTNGMLSLAIILSETMAFLFLITMILFMNPLLALIIFIIGSILGIIINKFILPQFYKWGQHLQETNLYSYQNILQFFHAFKEILLLGKREYFVQAYKFHSHNKYQIQAIQNAINTLPRMIIEILFVGLFVTTIAFLCLKHESPMQMLGILGGYMYAGFRLMPGLNRIVSQLNLFKSAIPFIERVYSEYNAVEFKNNYLDIPKLMFNQTVDINNISFSYLNTNKEAIKNISLEIKKGEKIGIIGETGAGKSTLVDIILGLLKPYKGSVLIDNKYPVNSYQWHQKIGYVPQSVYLTDDTIEANIAFGEKEIDMTQLNKVIDAAQLRKLIDQLPNGAKTIVGERGIRLSGGERQRIAIARALYHNPEVLIFDEATSALDTETEERLMETINIISSNHTVIMIAHRVTTLKDCDRIVILENRTLSDIVTYHALKNLPQRGTNA